MYKKPTKMDTNRKTIGWNFLQQHRKLQSQLDLEDELVIVNRDHWLKVIGFFEAHPELVLKLTKQIIKNETSNPDSDNNFCSM